MGHNKYIISLKYWESKLLECYLLSQSRKDILLCSQYISYIPSFISAREPPLQETHQGVQSLTVPALQPVRHTFVMPNPSIHFSPLWHKYIFPFFHLLSLFYQGQTWTPWKTHTHTHIQGREISRACHFTFTFEPFSWRSHPGWLTETVQRQGWTRMVRCRWRQESRRRRRQVYMYLLQFGELVWWPSDPWNPSFKN